MITGPSVSRGVMLLTILGMVLIGPWNGAVFSASDFRVGTLAVADAENGKKEGPGQCLIYTGPHGEFLDEEEVLMQISDSSVQDGVDFEISGARPNRVSKDLDDRLDRDLGFFFRPEKTALKEDVEAYLAKKDGGKAAEVRIISTVAYVESEGEDGDEVITCHFRVSALVLENDDREREFLHISFDGEGRRYTDFHGRFQGEEALLLGAQAASGESLSSAAAASNLGQNNCPNPLLSETQWTGNSRIPTNCPTADCLVSFGGYLWWTNYHYRGDDRWHSFYFDNGQPWSPRNVSVTGEGLHLKVAKDDLGGGSQWAASEVVAMFKDDGNRTPARLGYGRYLVAARVKTAPSFANLDTNVAFGAFTYQKDESADQKNPYRELDLVEISRWGAPPCTALLDPGRLCTGHAQHTLQIWDAHPENLHRFDLDLGVSEVTLVMEWPGAHQPVTFKLYHGVFADLAAADAATPARSWTTKTEQNDYVPASDCQRFHLNLWMGNFQADKPEPQRGVHPPPVSGSPQEVVVTSFVYEPN